MENSGFHWNGTKQAPLQEKLFFSNQLWPIGKEMIAFGLMGV